MIITDSKIILGKGNRIVVYTFKKTYKKTHSLPSKNEKNTKKLNRKSQQG